MKRLFAIIFVLSSLLLNISAQDDVKYQKEPVFNDGEHATYNIYFNWGWIWIHAGNVEFSVKKKTLNGEDSYFLFVSGYTRKTFDKMYTIRDTFSSYISASTLAPIFYNEVKHEDSYYCNKKYYYKKENNKTNVYLDMTRYTKHWKDTVSTSEEVRDLISTCYNFRNIDGTSLNKNDVIPFNMLIDNEIYKLGLKYKGKEKIELKNGNKYNALKFVPKLVTGDLFKKEDDMTIYVSDDENHIPLLITAKIKVGSIKAMLSDIKNTKNPISSQIK